MLQLMAFAICLDQGAETRQTQYRSQNEASLKKHTSQLSNLPLSFVKYSSALISTFFQTHCLAWTSFLSLIMDRPKVKHIPNITNLRKALGFGIPRDSRSRFFNNTVEKFRKAYKSAGGTAGCQFVAWHDGAQSEELQIMADKFLERRGPQFWSDAGSSTSKPGPIWIEDGSQ
jgi:hypothetical protein